MRDMDDMVKDLREQVGAITRDEEQQHREAKYQFREARDLLELSRRFERQLVDFETDALGQRRLVESYKKVVAALEDAAETHTQLGEGHVEALARTKKRPVTIQTSE